MLNTQDNALFLNTGLPQFQLFSVNHVETSIDELLKNVHHEFVNIENKLEENDYNTTELYHLAIYETEIIEYPLDYAWSMISHLKSVNNSDELRDVYETCMPKVIQENSYMSQSKPLFNALKKLKDSNELDHVQQRIIDSSYQSMFLSGIDLEEDKKERFNKIKLRLGELTTQFSNNVLDSIKNYDFYITDEKYKEEMLQIPLYARELYSQSAQKKYASSTPENGPWKISLDPPSLMPFLSHCPNSELRESVYKSYISKASSGEHNNLPIIKEILNLKEEIAQLLGYKNYVEISLSRKMASSQEQIEDILNELALKSKHYALHDMKELKDFMKEIHPSKEKLELWDISYYSEKLKETKYKYKEEDLKPYFALENVLKGLFQVAQQLFNIEIEEVDIQKEGIQVWHKYVKFFHIYDLNTQEKEQIASFYLDPFSRPGEKNGGAWMDVCVQKSKILNKKPVAYLICNGTPPIKDSDGSCSKPSLMTFDEVVTLFHEFGHGLQHMITTIDEAGASGINNIEWDAVELPSQFMENWCYHQPTLKSFAKHYISGQPLPNDLFQKIIDNKNYHVGLGMLRQIYFGTMDLHLHSTSIKDENDIIEIQRTYASKYLVRPILDEDRFLCAFSHIFAGGYSAGYYSYKWAEIMSCDAFGAFEEANLEDINQIKELGMKFRNTVLSMGGGTHPSTVFKKFRGREPKVDALLRQNGLISE